MTFLCSVPLKSVALSCTSIGSVFRWSRNVARRSCGKHWFSELCGSSNYWHVPLCQIKEVSFVNTATKSIQKSLKHWEAGTLTTAGARCPHRLATNGFRQLFPLTGQASALGSFFETISARHPSLSNYGLSVTNSRQRDAQKQKKRVLVQLATPFHENFSSRQQSHVVLSAPAPQSCVAQTIQKV